MRDHKARMPYLETKVVDNGERARAEVAAEFASSEVEAAEIKREGSLRALGKVAAEIERTLRDFPDAETTAKEVK